MSDLSALGFQPTESTPKKSATVQPADKLSALGFTPTGEHTAPETKQTPQANVQPFGNSIVGAVPNFLSNIGTGMGSALGQFAFSVPQTAANIASGILGAVGPKPESSEAISKGLESAKQNIYVKPNEQVSQTPGGIIGNVAGTIAPYMVGGGEVNAATEGLSLIPKVIARTAGDVGVSQLQTGGNANAGLGVGVPSLAANLLPGGSMTQRVVKSAVPGYLADVTMGATGQRGEDRTGMKALIPGLGTVLGLGMALPEAKKFTPKEVSGAIDDLQQKYIDNLNGWVAPRKMLAKNQAVTAMKNAAGTEGVEGTRVLSERGIIPNTENGKFSTLGQASDLRTKIDPLAEANRSGLKEVEQASAPISIEELRVRTIKNIQSKNLTATAEESMIDKANKSFDAYSRKYGQTIPITKLDDVKSAEWGETKFDMAVPQLERDAHYQVAKSMQKKIEEVATEAGHTHVAQLNRHIGDIQEAAKTLEALNGHVLVGGRMTKNFNRLAGAVIGSAQGPLGSILGLYGGDELTSALQKYSIASPFTRSILKNLQETEPAAYTKTMEWLKKQQFDREGRLMLPEKGYQAPTEYESGAKKSNMQNSAPNGMPMPAPEPRLSLPAPSARTNVNDKAIPLPPEGGFPKPKIGPGYQELSTNLKNNTATINADKGSISTFIPKPKDVVKMGQDFLETYNGFDTPKTKVTPQDIADHYVTNTVDQLKYQGQNDIAKKIQNIDTSKVNTFADLEKQVKDTAGNNETTNAWLKTMKQVFDQHKLGKVDMKTLLAIGGTTAALAAANQYNKKDIINR